MRQSAPKAIFRVLVSFWTILPANHLYANERPEMVSRPAEAAGELTTEIDTTKDIIYLKEHALKALRIVKKIDLRLRVYIKKTETDKKYEQFLSGKNGKLGVPASFLLAGTVVRGDRLGGNKNRFYVLSADGAWRATTGPELYYVQYDTKEGRRVTQTPNEDDDMPSQVASTATTHTVIGGE